MLRRLLMFTPGLVAVAFAALHVGCGDDGAARSPDTDGLPEPVDGGTTAESDLSAPDAGPSPTESGGFPANDAAGFGLDAASSERVAFECYSASTGLDCAAPSCAAIPVCCVGSATPLCCAATELARIDFTGCADPSCAAAQTFGEPAPYIDGGLVPGGGALSDGGLVFTEPVDLRNHTLTVRGTLRPPADCDGGCFETLALAVLETVPAGTGAVLEQPLVALRYTGATGRFLVQANRATLAELEDEPSGEWTLELTPEGRVLVAHEGVTRFDSGAGLLDVDTGHAAVVGRTRNPSASGGMGVALTSLAVTTGRCDVPGGWAPGSPVDFTEAPEGTLRQPSLSPDGLLAVSVDGVPRFFRRSVSRRFDPLAVALPETPALTAVRFLSDGDVVALAIDGSIHRGAVVADAPEVVLGETLVGPCAACLRTSPSVALAYDGTPIVLVLEDGEPMLYAFGVAQLEYVEPLAALIAPDPAAGEDRIQSVALRNEDGAYRLDVTYVRGTRSAVRHFASEELVLWRDLGRTFTPSGEGFDALRAWDFEASPGVDRIEAVFIASDGVRDQVGLTSRPTP